MKDVKHIKQVFHSLSWVMSQGWDLEEGLDGGGGVWYSLFREGGGGQKLFFAEIQPNLVCE